MNNPVIVWYDPCLSTSEVATVPSLVTESVSQPTTEAAARKSQAAQCMVCLLVLFSFVAQYGSGQEQGAGRGGLQGTVFVGSPGSELFVPGAQVFVSGPVMAETETGDDGTYVFNALPPGTYEVDASYEDLTAYQSVAIKVNQVLQLALQLNPPDVKTSVIMTASDVNSGVPAPTETRTEKAVTNSPNINEQFEGLLPLVPRVVRGPDGLINLKGARTTQSGGLVNSANVTDPATGSPVISFPIDVVSSGQVIWNP